MTRIPRPWRSPRLPPTVCWIWPGSKSRDGYGHVAYGRTTIPAHRLAYLECVGPIPVGFEIHHTCRNRACVNPAHLQALTPTEHVAADGERYTLKTHCPAGHAFEADNVLVGYSRGRPYRRCRQCACERDRRRYAVERTKPAYRAAAARRMRENYQRRKTAP